MIQPSLTGDYIFYIESEDGVRLTINDEIIIDNRFSFKTMNFSNPVNEANIANSSVIGMNARSFYTFTLEYKHSLFNSFKEGYDAYCRLFWKSDKVPLSEVQIFMKDTEIQLLLRIQIGCLIDI